MHRPSWLRRSKKPEAKAEVTTTSNPMSLALSTSNIVTTPDPGPSNASSVPQSNGQSCGSLWDKAYEDLRIEKEDLVDVFEKLLLSEPDIEPTLTAADGDPSKRQQQISALVTKKLKTMEQEQWKLQIGGKSIEVRQQVNRIVKVVLVGKDFITSAANMDPIHAGLPWAGVCMLLPLLTKDSEQRTAATDGLEYISGLIRRYTQIEQIYLGDEDFPLKDDLQSSMTKLYKHILEYEARAACQFNRNAAYQWVRNVVEADSWKAIIGTIKDLDAACDKLAWIIDAKDQRVRTIRLESYLERQNHEVRELFSVSREQEEEQGKLHMAELKAGRQEQNDWHRNAEESACYECLRTTDYESNKNKNPDRIPGTCEWFLRHPRYGKWLDEQGSAWLWVTADPGCGKSVLSRFLVDEYKKGVGDTNTICYYFFKDDSEEGRSATHALCAILHQLFSQNNNLLRHAIPEYQRNGNKLPQLFNELWSIFILAAADPNAGSIVCILDALDECAESTQLPIIRKLARYYQNPGVTTKLKFIVVSRPYASIGDAFWEENQNVASVQLMGESETEMEAIRVEIDWVIKEKVKRFNSRRLRKGVDDDAHIAVQEELRTIENRTYLWVSLIFPELEKKAGLAKSKLLQLINDIPKSVDEAYERILNQSSDREQAKKLLHIVVAAKRPLNLTEMNIALSMKEGATSVEDLELEPESSFQTTVRDLCGLFVAIRESTVHLIHQTAKEFLVAKDTTSDPANIVPGLESWKHSLEPAKSNHVLGMICISYLSLDEFECDPLVLKEEDNTDKEDKEDEEENDGEEDEGFGYNSKGSEHDPLEDHMKKYRDTMNKYVEMHPLLEYATQNWSLHLLEAGSLEDPMTLKAALTICASHSNRLQTWFHIYWWHTRDVYPHPEDITDLMVGSYLGLKGIVKSCLAQGAEINSKDTAFGWTPLVFAAWQDHEAIVKILLEHGADPNIQTKYGGTPLIDATDMDHQMVVKTLLKYGAEPNIETKTGGTPLLHASNLDDESIMKTLLEHGADPKVQGGVGNTPLMDAARKGWKTSVKMLLESSADSNIQDDEGRTALMDAALMHHETVVKMLLESNADSNIQDDEGRTALMDAALMHHETVVKMLLESNADPNIQDDDGHTALMEVRTVRQLWDCETIAKILLESSTDPNIQDNEDSTAKWRAAPVAHTTIVKMLLEYGADANLHDRHGDTVLMKAALRGDETTVKIVLDYDADPSRQDIYGHTALMTAVWKEHETVVKMLLEHGVDPNIPVYWGNTALMVAAVDANSASKTTVRILLEYGANPKIQNDEGQTATMLAKEEKVKVNMRLQEGVEPPEQDELLVRDNRLQAIVDMLLEYETEPAGTSKDNDGVPPRP